MDAAWDIAREDGLAAVTLRGVADRVGMRSPSLYTHFESKNAIYDAMFGQAWGEYLELMQRQAGRLPKAPRKALHAMLRTFVEFNAGDVVRFQIMNQRVVHGFTPSEENYAPSVRVMETFVEELAGIGITDREDADLIAATVGGLIDAHFANDPGGDRYIRQFDRVIDMLADELGLPGPRIRSRR